MKWSERIHRRRELHKNVYVVCLDIQNVRIIIHYELRCPSTILYLFVENILNTQSQYYLSQMINSR